MNPNETLNCIEGLVEIGEDFHYAEELCDGLLEWINKDGFEPDWEKYPVGTKYYQDYVFTIQEGHKAWLYQHDLDWTASYC